MYTYCLGEDRGGTKMKPTLTIFTPSYNRAKLLQRGYNALCRQTCKDFIWMIIDDGSTDNTFEVVSKMKNKENGFEIQYIYKENGGLHTGYNTAIENATTELCMCIDSDDWIADGAVDKIIKVWKRVKKENCAGICGLDADTSGKPTCYIDTDEEYINLNTYDVSHKWAGDRKLVIRTDLYKQVAPMLTYEKEKNFNPQYMHIKIAEKYLFYVMNEVLCIVDYQESGMSAGIFKQYLNSPNSFAEYRRLQMTIRPNKIRYIAKNAIHYDSSCILAGKPKDIVLKSPNKFLTTILAPAGLILSLYIKNKARG